MSTPKTGGVPDERPTLKFPEHLRRGFADTARRRGHIRTTLMFGWMNEGLLRTRLGLPLAPPERDPGSGGTRDMKTYRWTQDPQEFDRWSAVLADAGWDMRAWLADRIQWYVAVDGDLERMPEPGKDDEDGELPLAS